jgi:cell division septation protein DedD
MIYDFAIDKKSIGFLIAGSVLVGILLFLAGWLVGANWSRPVVVASNVPAAPTVTAPVVVRPALPAGPAIQNEAVRPEVAAPEDVIPPVKQNPDAPGADAGIETPKPAGAGGGGGAAAAAGAADPKIVERADGAAADPPGANEPVEKMTAFSVEVGVFPEEKEANDLVEAMESKGYSTSIFVANDLDNRQWYSVRIGAYADRAEAAQAASKFTEQEKIKAVVRPINAL